MEMLLWELRFSKYDLAIIIGSKSVYFQEINFKLCVYSSQFIKSWKTKLKTVRQYLWKSYI